MTQCECSVSEPQCKSHCPDESGLEPVLQISNAGIGFLLRFLSRSFSASERCSSDARASGSPE